MNFSSQITSTRTKTNQITVALPSSNTIFDQKTMGKIKKKLNFQLHRKQENTTCTKPLIKNNTQIFIKTKENLLGLKIK